MLSVVSFGEALIDFIPVDEGNYFPFVGGAPANVAAAVAKLGGKSHFLGGISTDSFGQLIQQQLTSIKVKLAPELITTEKTAMVVVSLDDNGERSFQFYRDNTADLAVTTEKLNTLNWSQFDIFHFCSNTMTEERIFDSTLFALSQAKKHQTVVSFDVNLRLNLWPKNSNDLLMQRFNQVLDFCDIIKFSDEELIHFCKVYSLDEASLLQQLFNSDVKVILVTAGGDAVKIITPEFNADVQPPATKAIDTTAGGDSFIGGFLFQLSSVSKNTINQVLSSQDVLVNAVEFASKCGAHTVANKGAISALPMAEDIKA